MSTNPKDAIEFILPLRTWVHHGGGHWRANAKRAKEQRDFTVMFMRSLRVKTPLPPFPVRVTLVRVGVGTCDRQNLPSAMKHVIDGIADVYGVNDKDERWEFVAVDQERSRTYAVKVKIESILTGESHG